MLLESVKRKKINMFVLKSGYTPYTLIPLTPEGGIKKKQMIPFNFIHLPPQFLTGTNSGVITGN